MCRGTNINQIQWSNGEVRFWSWSVSGSRSGGAACHGKRAGTCQDLADVGVNVIQLHLDVVQLLLILERMADEDAKTMRRFGGSLCMNS